MQKEIIIWLWSDIITDYNITEHDDRRREMDELVKRLATTTSRWLRVFLDYEYFSPPGKTGTIPRAVKTPRGRPITPQGRYFFVFYFL